MKTGTLNWWGEVSPDMGSLDERCLCFDSEVATTTTLIAGIVRLSLRVKFQSGLTDIVIRFEDVYLNPSTGQVDISLITGGGINSSLYKCKFQDPHYMCRLPEFVSLPDPSVYQNILVPLHYTTWTLKPGHRLRVAISNVEFPLAWPKPQRPEISIETGSVNCLLRIPVIREPVSPVILPEVVNPNLPSRPHVTVLKSIPLTPFEISHEGIGEDREAVATSHEYVAVQVGYPEDDTFRTFTRENIMEYRVNLANPAIASFKSVGKYDVIITSTNGTSRTLNGRSEQKVSTADEREFRVSVNRILAENNKDPITYEADRSFPRTPFQ
jgi:hypothetical protein